VPQSIGRMRPTWATPGVLMRAYVYARLLGREGMHRVAEYATLNANYLGETARGRLRPGLSRSAAPAMSSSSR
jgi:glycine dehydrogenase subunit 2